MTDGDKDDTSPAIDSLRNRVRAWEEQAQLMRPDEVLASVQHLNRRASAPGGGEAFGDPDMVAVHRSSLITVLERGAWPIDREWYMSVPDHHQLTTTSTAEGDPEAALLAHVALALDNLNLPAEARARILGYLLSRETDQMKDTETP